jgi:enoyl-CoA hydratase
MNHITPTNAQVDRRDAAALVGRTDNGGITTLTLNRPNTLNALSPALFVELRAHVDLIAASDEVAAVVLRGAGRSFSAGNDLKAIEAGQTAPTPTFQADTIDALAALPQPSVAVVHGHCYTGALELALGCDLIVAASDATFADTHAKWAMAPAWGMSQRLPRRVGAMHAKYMMFTGRAINADEAVQIGLAVAAVGPDLLEQYLDDLLGSILANSAFTHRTNKRFIAVGSALSLEGGLAFERVNRPTDNSEMLERLGRARG